MEYSTLFVIAVSLALLMVVQCNVSFLAQDKAQVSASTVDSSDNVYITGTVISGGSIDFTEQITAAAGHMNYVAKFSPSGVFQWVQTISTQLTTGSSTLAYDIVMLNTSVVCAAGRIPGATSVSIHKSATPQSITATALYWVCFDSEDGTFIDYDIIKFSAADSSAKGSMLVSGDKFYFGVASTKTFTLESDSTNTRGSTSRYSLVLKYSTIDFALLDEIAFTDTTFQLTNMVEAEGKFFVVGSIFTGGGYALSFGWFNEDGSNTVITQSTNATVITPVGLVYDSGYLYILLHHYDDFTAFSSCGVSDLVYDFDYLAIIRYSTSGGTACAALSLEKILDSTFQMSVWNNKLYISAVVAWDSPTIYTVNLSNFAIAGVSPGYAVSLSGTGMLNTASQSSSTLAVSQSTGNIYWIGQVDTTETELFLEYLDDNQYAIDTKCLFLGFFQEAFPAASTLMISDSGQEISHLGSGLESVFAHGTSMLLQSPFQESTGEILTSSSTAGQESTFGQPVSLTSSVALPSPISSEQVIYSSQFAEETLHVSSGQLAQNSPTLSSTDAPQVSAVLETSLFPQHESPLLASSENAQDVSVEFSNMESAAVQSNIPQEPVSISSGQPPHVSPSTNIVEESVHPVEPSVVEERLVVAVQPSAVFFCSFVSFSAMANRQVVSYSWRIDKMDVLNTKVYESEEVTLGVNFGELEAGSYSINVEVSDGVTTATASYTATKPEFSIGPNCQGSVELYASSFDISVTSGDIPEIDRMKKLVIKSKAIVGYAFEWTVLDSTTRRSALATCSSIMCPFVTTSRFSSDGFVIDPHAAAVVGFPPAHKFEIGLTITDLQTKIAAFKKKFQLITNAAEAPKLYPNSPGFTVSALNFVPDANSIKQGLNGYGLTTNFNLTAIIGDNGWQVTEQDNAVFVYSYLDESRNTYIPLSTSSDGRVVTKLPTGYGSSFSLLIQLRVVNRWELSSSVTRTVRVGAMKTVSFAESVQSMSSLAEDALKSPSDSEEFISAAVTVATFVSQNSANLAQDTKAKQQLEKIVENLIGNIQITNGNETFVQQQMAVVEVLTRTSSVLSDKAKSKALDTVQSVIRARAQNGTRPTVETFQGAARVLSNIVGSSTRNRTIANQLFSTATDLARALVSDKLPSEKETLIATENFDILVKSDRSEQLDNSAFIASENNSTVIRIPNNFSRDTNSTDGVVSVTVLVFKNNLYAFASDEDTASPVVDVTFLTPNNTALAVTNLTQPLVIQMEKSSTDCKYMGERAKYECLYFDEDSQVWRGDGCSWIANSEDDTQLNCYCTHTTSFSAFLLTKGKCPLKTPKLNLSSIVINSVYVVFCSILLLLLLLARRSQPVRSRYIAPFLGLSAIIIDAVLNGWIKNSLLYANQNKISDYFSYAIMLTSNPLSVVAMFAFLWQQVRFLLLQNMYFIMAKQENNKLHSKILRFSRLLTSKLVFSLSCTAVGIVVFLYFLAFVLASAISKESSATTNTLITAQAVSYMAMIMTLGFLIIVAVIVDVIMAFLRSKEATEISGSVQASKQAKGLNVIFVNIRTKDVLFFRRESIFIVIAICVMFILYPVGISSAYKEEMLSLVITRQAIEYCYMFLSIVAFGGFISIVGCIAYLQKKRVRAPSEAEVVIDQAEKEQQQGVVVVDEVLLNVLTDAEGFKVFHKYCTLEFSLENLLLWRELEELRASNLIMSPPERKSALERINNMYIQRNAEREVNLSNSSKQAFQRVVQLSQPNVAEAEEAYCKLYSVCMNNLGDTFTRLTTSELYKRYNDTKTTMIELQQDFL